MMQLAVSPRRLGPCCPVVCDYRPEAVELYLDMIRAYERKGEDAGLVASCKPANRNGTGGSAGDGATRIWDVQQAIKTLRSEHRPVTADSVAAKLCPWAVEE